MKKLPQPLSFFSADHPRAAWLKAPNSEIGDTYDLITMGGFPEDVGQQLLKLPNLARPDRVYVCVSHLTDKALAGLPRYLEPAYLARVTGKTRKYPWTWVVTGTRDLIRDLVNYLSLKGVAPGDNLPQRKATSKHISFAYGAPGYHSSTTNGYKYGTGAYYEAISDSDFSHYTSCSIDRSPLDVRNDSFAYFFKVDGRRVIFSDHTLDLKPLIPYVRYRTVLYLSVEELQHLEEVLPTLRQLANKRGVAIWLMVNNENRDAAVKMVKGDRKINIVTEYGQYPEL